MKQFTFMWFIENYSYCWHERGKQIVSPIFYVEVMQQTSWNLGLYPRGSTNEDFISLYLNRISSWNRSEKIALNYELSLLDAKGKVAETVEIKEYEFKKGVGYGSTLFVKRDKIKEKFLAQDVLKVCCRMWIGEGKVDNEICTYARTRIGIEKISFINTVGKFSMFELNQKKPFDVNSVSKEGLKLSGNVYVTCEQDCEEEVVVEITPNSKNVFAIACKLYLLNSAGNETEFGKTVATDVSFRKYTVQVRIKFEKRALLEQKPEYLLNDMLIFRCECKFSTGIEFERIEETFYDLHLTPLLKKNLRDTTASMLLSESKSVTEDLRSIYYDQILCDIQLKTENRIFSAHKAVLCARSSVLKTMLTTNMTEKTMECIEIDDLEDNIVEQFLLFLYSDTLEDLQWENALKLYYAADKYQVKRLKDMCSSFLITEINASNVSDLLILADKHQDSNLKTASEDFICENDEQIFGTDEWKCFMESSPQLAMQTMMHLLSKKRNV
ncbi:Speckle-type POZ protein [Araneus ventricosus]|uniref:Speckle-type POZ protein n=1 Tax=Araneus ventricosus TaxID=182803 RepID=A0A4Y2UZ92_ARAVE|nr:Speckle-type POZ protein [Araneus ventricosus]